LIDTGVYSPPFAVAFTRERRLNALFLARFQVKRVPFDLFNDVFLEDFTLEAPQRIIQRFTFLESNLGQRKSPRFPANCVISLPAGPSSSTAGAFASSEASSAGGFGARYVHIQRAPVHVRPVHLGNGVLRFSLVRHFHESKSTRLPSGAVSDDVHTLYVAVLRERRMKLFLRRLVTQIPDKDIDHCIRSLFLGL
jgi:hypothetical protein